MNSKVSELKFNDEIFEIADEQARNSINHLASVATTGDFNDLNNKPIFPTKISEYSDARDYLRKDEASKVTTSGSYNDLNNKPTISNSTISFKINATSVSDGTFTLNQTSNKVINFNVPTKVTDLSDGGDYVTLNTPQTISSEKTFTANIIQKKGSPRLSLYDNNSIKGAEPASSYSSSVQFMDKNGKLLGTVQTNHATNKNIITELRAYKANSADDTSSVTLQVVYPAEGDPYGIAPSTSINRTNGTDIVTRNWIPKDTRIVHTTGNETIAGTKTFSSSPVAPTPAASDNSTKIATTAFIKNILSSLYPVGSLYITTNNSSTCPLASLISGSSWTLVAADKALWTSNRNANTTINAGLPNITGDVTYGTGRWHNTGIIAKSGAFSGSSPSVDVSDYHVYDDEVSTYTKAAKIKFNASSSNSIYGNSSTVQPPAYRVNVWRRTA